MCWFVICPRTGKYLGQVEQPVRGRRRTLYLRNGAFEAFFDVGWRFREFLAPHPRPPFEDLVAYVLDGTIPESMTSLVGPELARHHRVIQDFWASLNEGKDGYPALLGRPMLREEKYWLVRAWLRDLAVGREQFYAGKTIRREEWLVNWRGWDGRHWDDRCQGRLRVFSDGTADAWYPGVGLLGFDTEEAARRELAAASFGTWEEVKASLSRFRKDAKPLVDPPAPPVSQADDPQGPFRYEGS